MNPCPFATELTARRKGGQGALQAVWSTQTGKETAQNVQTGPWRGETLMEAISMSALECQYISFALRDGTAPWRAATGLTF